MTWILRMSLICLTLNLPFAISGELDGDSKKSVLKAFNDHLKKDLNRIKSYMKDELKDIKKPQLKKAVKDNAFFDNLIFSVYESNKWFLLDGAGLSNDFKVIHEGCRKFMFHNPEYSSVLKKSPRYKAFSFADYLAGETFGCLYHKTSKGRMKYRAEVRQAKNLILYLMRDQSLLKQLKKANNQLSRELGAKKTGSYFSPMDFFIPEAKADLKKNLKAIPCGIGVVPLWLGSFPALLALDYSILLPFTAYNLMKGEKGEMGTGGFLSKDYTLKKAFYTCRDGSSSQ